MILQDDMVWLASQNGVYTRVELSTYYRDPTISVGQYCLMQSIGEKILDPVVRGPYMKKDGTRTQQAAATCG